MSISNVKITAGDRLLNVSWTSTRAGNAIVVKWRPTGSAIPWSAAERLELPPSAVRCTIPSLIDGTEYDVQIDQVDWIDSGSGTGTPLAVVPPPPPPPPPTVVLTLSGMTESVSGTTATVEVSCSPDIVNVTLEEGGVKVASDAVPVNGKASWTLASLAPGTHTLSAQGWNVPAGQSGGASNITTVAVVIPGVPPTPPPPPPPPSGKATVGYFLGSQQPSAVEALGASLGVPAQAITVYAGGPGYTTYSAPKTPLQLLLGVGAVTPAQATAIGQSLVAAGASNAIIRIMWEMNANWFSWGTQALSASQYISIFRAAQQAFAAVPGNRFSYNWCLAAGTVESGRTLTDTYPGDPYVTNIAFDHYDFNDPGSVAPILAFAKAHGKPVSIDEWGLNGKDNPAFIDFMAGVIKDPANDVVLHAYFSYAGNPNSDISQFPNARAEFTKQFS